MHLFDTATKLLFFTGKGGVGKTSLACATAVHLAERGKRVLLVSTDPASNLGHVFGQEIGTHSPTAIIGVGQLFALNLDPSAAAQAYRDRVIGPVRGQLPEVVVQSMEEQLSGACTTEIAAFDEFTGLLTDSQLMSRYDHILFDTAPTGHTLRLLQLPTAWSGFLQQSTAGASCLGPLAGLEKQRAQYAAAVEQLANPQMTKIVLVSRPQHTALAEAARTSRELAQLGVHNQQLIVNGLRHKDDGSVRADQIRHRLEQEIRRSLPMELTSLPLDMVWLRPENMVGLDALRSLLDAEPSALAAGTPPFIGSPIEPAEQLSTLIDQIEQSGRGVVMVLGKGGVGKTTVATEIAVELAKRGHEVLLTTTDPAAHLSMVVESTVPNLQVGRIDPAVESERYRQHLLATQGAALDSAGRALLEEDLRSPCTEEIAVFQAFSRVLEAAHQKFVLIDTAPTGHTLLLLDAAGAYHREITRHHQPGAQPITPLMRLRDATQTKLIIVTLPETTPLLEAEALQSDLRRAGIEPWAWVINSVLSASSLTDPLLIARARLEKPYIDRVRQSQSRIALIPMKAEILSTAKPDDSRILSSKE